MIDWKQQMQARIDECKLELILIHYPEEQLNSLSKALYRAMKAKGMIQ